MHSNNGEIWKALFTYHWSGARLDPFHERKDHSASAILIGRVHAMRRRRWMFGKASLSHAPSASRRLLRSSFSADCHIICHLRSSFQRDLGNGRPLSQNNVPSVASDSSRVLLTMVEGTRYSKWRAWRSSSENLSCIWIIGESRRGITTDFL